ncbi:MAG: alpha/beta fold hydrolase [Xanthobacteraceae bacterium]|nr:alpha/beta fold hydrolase [Xanthobacteraceae bacterium]
MNSRPVPPLDQLADAPVARRDRIDPGSDYLAPEGETEARLSRLMQSVLRIDRVGRNDSFFELGGDSLQAVDLFVRIETAFGVALAPSTIIEHPTVARLAPLLAPGAAARCLVPLQSEGAAPPLFLVHDATGTVFGYRDLVRRLGPHRKVYALQWPGAGFASSIPEMARLYVECVKSIQPHGPYLLAGHSLGGTIAYEMAHQLGARGDRIGLLVSIDGENRHALMSGAQRFARKLAHQFTAMADAPPSAWIAHWIDAARAEVRRHRARRSRPAPAPAAATPGATHIDARLLEAHDRYAPPRHDGAMKLLRCTGGRGTRWKLRDLGWNRFVAGSLEILDIPSDHEVALTEPTVALVAAHLERWIAEAVSQPVPEPRGESESATRAESGRQAAADTISFVVVTETGAHACGRNLDVLRTVGTDSDEILVVTRQDHVAEVPYRGEGWLRVVGVPEASVFALRASAPKHARNDWIVLLEEHSLVTAATLEAARSIIRERRDVDLIMFLGRNLTSTGPWEWANFLHTFALVWAPIEGPPAFSPAPAAIVRRSVIGELREGGWEFELIPRLFASGRVAFGNEIYIDHVRPLAGAECLVLNFHNARACAGLSRRLGRPTRAILYEGWHVFAERPQQLTRALAPRLRELPAGTPWRLRAVGFAHLLGCLAGALFGPGRSTHAID